MPVIEQLRGMCLNASPTKEPTTPSPTPEASINELKQQRETLKMQRKTLRRETKGQRTDCDKKTLTEMTLQIKGLRVEIKEKQIIELESEKERLEEEINQLDSSCNA